MKDKKGLNVHGLVYRDNLRIRSLDINLCRATTIIKFQFTSKIEIHIKALFMYSNIRQCTRKLFSRKNIEMNEDKLHTLQ